MTSAPLDAIIHHIPASATLAPPVGFWAVVAATGLRAVAVRNALDSLTELGWARRYVTHQGVAFARTPAGDEVAKEVSSCC